MRPFIHTTQDNAELLALQRIDETCTNFQQNGQYLEALEACRALPAPLLSPIKAVALVRRGNRGVGVLSYGWLSPGDPDPAGARMEVVRRALEHHPNLVGLFWE